MPAISPVEEGTPDQDLLRRIGRKVRKRLVPNKAVQRIATDKAELWVMDRFFDEIECGRLVSMIDAVARPSTAYAHIDDIGVRTSHSGDLDPFDPFVRELEQRIDTLLGLDHGTGEMLQGQRYMPGQYFKPHIDWFPPGSPGWQRESVRGGQRALTAMVYLNAVAEGGETDFPELDIALRPSPGALLVWNNADENGVPNRHTVHSGNPVLRGTKYIVTKWYRCRRWR